MLKLHVADLGLSFSDIDTILDAICALAEEYSLDPGWLPILADPDYEPLVQSACDSAALRIVTHNIRHLAPARELGMEILPPCDFAAMTPLS